MQGCKVGVVCVVGLRICHTYVIKIKICDHFRPWKGRGGWTKKESCPICVTCWAATRANVPSWGQLQEGWVIGDFIQLKCVAPPWKSSEAAGSYAPWGSWRGLVGVEEGGRSWCNAQHVWAQREDHVLTCVSLRGRKPQRVWGLGEKSKRRRRADRCLSVAGGRNTWLFRSKCGGPPNPACYLADSPLNCHGALGQPAKRQHNQSKQAVSHLPQEQ